MTSLDDLRHAAHGLAQQLHQDIRGARAVLVSSPDGFELAQAGNLDDAARLAAMASSIAAIGQVVSQETSLGRPQCLVIDAEHGFLLLRTLQAGEHGLVLSVLTNRDALLGMAMHAVNHTARRVESA